MPDETPGATPRNIGTQCENIDLESATENNSTTKRLWLKSAVKKYFSLGVRTSDPLLTAAKWVAYITEVQFIKKNCNRDVFEYLLSPRLVQL